MLAQSVTLAGAKNGEDILGLAGHYYSIKDYNSSETECMRYQYLFPDGELYIQSLCLLAKTQYHSGNYVKSIRSLEMCRDRSSGGRGSEHALYLLGYVNLLAGSDTMGSYYLKGYIKNHPDGIYARDAAYLHACARALRFDFPASMEEIGNYKKTYGADDPIMELEKRVRAGEMKPQKSPLLGGIGSALLPGFGYFYTGRYALGFLALATNCLCGGLIYHGYINDNIYQMVLFSVMELSFYQYSIYGGVQSVYNYNSRKDFQKQIRLGLEQRF